MTQTLGRTVAILSLVSIQPLASFGDSPPEHLDDGIDGDSGIVWVEFGESEQQPDSPRSPAPAQEPEPPRTGENGAVHEDRSDDAVGPRPDSSPGDLPPRDSSAPEQVVQPAVQEENLCVDGEIVDGDCVEFSERICGVPGPVSVPTAQDPTGGISFAPSFCPDEDPEPEEPEEPEAAEPEEADAEPAVSEEPVEEDAPPPPPVITTADFLELPFEPAVVSFEQDLLGFGYLNRHVNVFADVDTQVISEQMLGYDVDIRALPAQFHWDYGDGTTRSTADPGAALPEYDSAGFEVSKIDTETATSHAYAETGRFPVTVETVFLGEYRIDGGAWIAIPGSATLVSEPGEADIWRTSTRNVSGPCEDTQSWGCSGPVELEEGDSPPEIFADQYDEHGNWLGPQH